MPYETLKLKWSREGWTDNSKRFGYESSVGSNHFPGETVVEQLTSLTIRYLDCLAQDFEGGQVELQFDAQSARTNSFLTEAEHLIVSAVINDLNDHQLIHIQEITKNCLGTVIAIVEGLLVTEPEEDCHQQTLQLHPDLCGLLRDVDQFWGHSGHQQLRVPYAPTRVGLEVTYEEIANLFRTSRVNIRELLHKGCFRKLRVRLKDFHG